MFENRGGNIPGGNFLGENFPGGIFQGLVWWVGIFRVEIFPGEFSWYHLYEALTGRWDFVWYNNGSKVSHENKEVKDFSVLYIFLILCLFSNKYLSVIALKFSLQYFPFYGFHIAIVK